MRKALALLAFLALTGFGCATTAPVLDQAAAERGVFEAKAAYEVALTAAVAYKKLPICGPSQPPCSTPAIVAQLQKAQPAARVTLDAAQAAVTSPGFGANILSTSVASATAAVAAFSAITSTLPK
jgi:hypothetical protein